MISDNFGFISVVVAGISALISSLSAIWAFQAAKNSQKMLMSKDGKVRPGPDIDETSGERDDAAEEVDK